MMWWWEFNAGAFYNTCADVLITAAAAPGGGRRLDGDDRRLVGPVLLLQQGDGRVVLDATEPQHDGARVVRGAGLQSGASIQYLVIQYTAASRERHDPAA